MSVLLIFLAANKGLGQIKEGCDSISTENYANKTLEYYYYIPEAVAGNKNASYPLLIMVPGLSGKGEWLVNNEVKEFAEREKFVVIAPSFVFDERNWDTLESYHYPSVWSGKALLEIIRQFEDKNNLFLSKFCLFGHSAGAQFVLRFALWKPQLCEACAAHASGGSIKPIEYVSVKFFVTIGKQDTSLRKKVAEEFFDTAKKNIIKVTYKEYDTGHDMIKEQFSDSLDFFTQGKMPFNENSGVFESINQKAVCEGFIGDTVVYLKNGCKTEGRFKSETDKKIILEIALGSTTGQIAISKNRVKSIKRLDK
ncbi:MAG: hypothetical protein HY810_01240 [Candidatus Omnitrophica bacterium]|nr:hypothetical protein [Candidatus Omnitrophota bacterium]